MASPVVTASVMAASIMASVMTIPSTMTAPASGLSGGHPLAVGIVILEVPPELDADGAPEAVLHVVASSINRP